MTTRSSQHRFSRGSSERRKYSRSDSEKRKRLRLIPTWLEKNPECMKQPQAPNSIYDQEAFQELLESVAEGNTVAVKLLAEAGVNVNMQDSDGCTPLHHAVAKGQDEVAEVLIMKGALKSRKNNDGLTPYEQKVEELVDDVFGEVSDSPKKSLQLDTTSNFDKRFDVEEPSISNQRSWKLKTKASFGRSSDFEDELPISRHRSSEINSRDEFKRSDVFEEFQRGRQSSRLNTTHFERSDVFEDDFPDSCQQSTRFNRRANVGRSEVFDELPATHQRSTQLITRSANYSSPSMNFDTRSSSYTSYQVYARKY